MERGDGEGSARKKRRSSTVPKLATVEDMERFGKKLRDTEMARVNL